MLQGPPIFQKCLHALQDAIQTSYGEPQKEEEKKKIFKKTGQHHA